jgi:hypothetical protein
LLEIARDSHHLGAKIGFLNVLHTWDQRLQHHPHVHCVLAAVGATITLVLELSILASLERNHSRPGKNACSPRTRPDGHHRMLAEPDAATIFHGKWPLFYRIRGFGLYRKRLLAFSLFLWKPATAHSTRKAEG